MTTTSTEPLLYSLTVLDDGQMECNDLYRTDQERAAALVGILAANHDEFEADEPPAGLTTAEVLDWYDDDLGDCSVDVHTEDVPAAAIPSYTIADLDGTDDEASWLAVGHVLDAAEVEWLRRLRIINAR